MAHYHGLSASRWADPPNNDQSNSLLSSTTPNFQLDGAEMEMKRYQTTPRITGLQEVQRYIVGMDVSHTSDMVHMHRLTNQNTQDIQEIRMVFKNDMTTLERKIRELELSKSRDSSPAPEYTMRNFDYSPTEDMLNNFSTDELVKAYRLEADEREEVALRLRQQAAALGGEVYSVPQRKLFEENPGTSTEPVSTPAAFACCDQAYDSIEELVDHVQKTHCSSLQTQASTSAEPRDTLANTPTHRPARTVQIKAPEEPLPVTPASKVDSVLEGSTSNKVNEAPPNPASAPKWSPVTVRNMLPITFDIPDHKETFTFQFLHDNLGGSFWSSGFYFESGDSILPSKAYWILDHDREPFIPQSLGQHGAKLTAFFNETPTEHAPMPDNYMNCPVFIKEDGANQYRYYGNYSQTRYSDKVGYDSLIDHIPERTLRQWADHLSETGRPEWVTRALQKHFWPQPEYEGPFPTDSAINTPATAATGGDSGAGGTERRVTNALHEYAKESKDWQKESRMHTSMLTSDAIFNAFKNPDSDVEPGLRLWWEYLECTNYDTGFYDMLVKIKKNPMKLAKRNGIKRTVARPAPPSTYTNPNPTPTVDDIETLPTLDDTIPHDDAPIELDPVHPPPPNPKQLQREQWASFNLTEAEAQAKKSTTFVKPSFNNPQLKSANAHLRKADMEAKKSAAVAFRKDKSHTHGVRPWETKGKESAAETASGWGGQAASNPWGPEPKESGGLAPNPSEIKDKEASGGAPAGWDGVGDMKAAKEFNNEVQDGRSLRVGKGKNGVPPHARAK
ncbi:hypothetical protein M409DRAFT_17856 [Zasmidium cellare ATCC 36951]|uniref:DUF6697 domain-containing protein n=1 Tax=Zasmidium cellare ATCC 36951 TaxID=1080233 RepID=A0A6A6D0L6_ZASCE|nr:uncharacterized protein M409DRAFT_17856 [Zasmidium cellare ATCC 36951]KAF2171619.1 hypothetical protein M409DRAFT_17856 [Zasmidium cellare ATCC 36951]